MSEHLRKFISRAPRYVLRPHDRSSMRFSLEHSQGAGGIEQTVLINLSETGIAFLTNAGGCPRMRERIKVEFPIPNGEQIAWWASVVRIEEYEPNTVFNKKSSFFDEPRYLVAARFEELPKGHARSLSRGIQQSFLQAVRDQQYRTWLYYRALFAHKFAKPFFLILVAVLAVAFFYLITRPDANYDPKRGAPWGERFKF